MLQRYLPHYRQTVHLAYPIVLGQISHILITVADNTMIGNFSSLALAAATFANALFAIIMMLGIAGTWVITPLVAKAKAEGDELECRKWLYHSLLVFPTLSVVFCTAVVILSFFADHFGQSPEVVAMAVPYVQVLAISLIFIIIFQVFKQFMDGLGETQEPMLINFAAAALNVVFNYMLIFGNWGFPAMGVLGGGIASLLARIFAALAIAWRFFTLPKFQPYVAQLHAVAYVRYYAVKLLKLGIPVGFQSVFEVSAFAFATIMVGWLGATELAAHQIALNIATITFMIASGISAAATIRVAQQFGQKKRRELLQAGFAAYHLVIAFMGMCAVAIALLRYWLPTFYVQPNDPEAVRMMSVSAQLLIYAALFQVSDGAQVVGMGVLRGIQDIKAPTIIAFVAYWVLGLPIGYVLGFTFHLGVNGIWLGLALALTFAAIFLGSRFFNKGQQIKMTT
ncbi:MAG: MATE family efflux transporter [Cytophagales bacterium]|nr:MATE family efflux transporter [Bernardetiaceae bacterium]MDW8204939.1 MATE family efflux transporter [Cytophagales bacterium]